MTEIDLQSLRRGRQRLSWREGARASSDFHDREAEPIWSRWRKSCRGRRSSPRAEERRMEETLRPTKSFSSDINSRAQSREHCLQAPVDDKHGFAGRWRGNR